jgi:hypothetical protein
VGGLFMFLTGKTTLALGAIILGAVAFLLSPFIKSE